MKNRIKEFLSVRLMHNIGYKILSLVIAIVVWLIVINVADPITTRTFNGLEVEIRNQAAITSINQVYEVVEGNTIDFVVKGKASVIKNLKMSDFNAYADLSMLSPVLATDIVVKCDVNESIEIDTKNKMLVVKLEDVKEKNFQVVVETKGEVSDGYYIGDYEIKPNIITVSGGASKINQIENIKVQVNVDGAKKSFSAKVEPVAYDSYGKAIDYANFAFSNSGTPITEVRVNTTIFKTKTIPVVLKITGEPAEGYQYRGEYEYTPKSVSVSGATRVLKKIESIEIPIDITGFAGEYENNISLAEYLPEGVKAVNSEEDISVRIALESMYEKDISISSEDIEMRNVSELYEVILKEPEKVYTIKIKATKDKIENIEPESVKAYVDLANATEGDCFLQLQFEGLETVFVVSEPQLLSVTLEKKESEGFVPEPTEIFETNT